MILYGSFVVLTYYVVSVVCRSYRGSPFSALPVVAFHRSSILLFILSYSFLSFPFLFRYFFSFFRLTSPFMLLSSIFLFLFLFLFLSFPLSPHFPSHISPCPHLTHLFHLFTFLSLSLPLPPPGAVICRRVLCGSRMPCQYLRLGSDSRLYMLRSTQFLGGSV